MLTNNHQRPSGRTTNKQRGKKMREFKKSETWKVYFQPKNGADGGPHYMQTDTFNGGDREFCTREDAEKAAQECIDDGIGKFWDISVR